jgi:chemotaxis response regulator CheB
VQHIGDDFTQSLAEWLNSRTRLSIRVPKAGQQPESGTVDLAGGDHHLVIAPDGRYVYTPYPTDYPYRPSVNVFFESAAQVWSTRGVAVLLTGMGTDGARGLLALKNRGWHTIAQDEATSVVYGMPKAAVERGAATEILPLHHIGFAAKTMLQRVRQ